MKCYICDQPLRKIDFDNDLKTLPCEECADTIHSTVQDYETIEIELEEIETLEELLTEDATEEEIFDDTNEAESPEAAPALP